MVLIHIVIALLKQWGKSLWVWCVAMARPKRYFVMLQRSSQNIPQNLNDRNGETLS